MVGSLRGEHKGRRRAGGVLAAALLGVALAGGCSTLGPAPDNEAILAELQDLKRESPLPQAIAVAPVQVDLVYAREAEEGEGEQAASEEGAPPAGGAGAEQPAGQPGGPQTGMAPLPAGASLAATDLPRLATRLGIEVRYRRPLFRELLFSPRDPLEGGPVEQPGTEDAGAGGQPGVLYVCPRCQNEVSATIARCPWCGLAFAPELPPGEPASAPPQAVAEQAPPAATPAPAGEAVAARAEVDRYICYFCESPIEPTALVCPNCGVELQPVPGLQGELAREEQGPPGKEERIGRLTVGALKRLAQSRAAFGVDPVEVQRDLAQLVEGLGLFSEVTVISEQTLVGKTDALLDWAAGNYIDYLMIPRLRRNEIQFVKTNASWWGGLALWVAAWVPSFWVAGEDYQADVELELEVWSVRARKPMPQWNPTVRGRAVASADQLDRRLNLFPWLGWDFIGVPAGFANLTDGGWLNLNRWMTPNAFADMKRNLLKQLHEYFAVAGAYPPPPVDVQEVALLVGVHEVRRSPGVGVQRQLQFAINDLEAMKLCFTQVTGWDPGAAGAAGRAGRRSRTVALLPGAENPELQATTQNLRNWLNVDLQRLGPNDTFVFYFAGYGAALPAPPGQQPSWADGYERYLITHDTDPSRIPETALNVVELMNAIRNCAARRVLIVLDCSFAKVPEDQSIGSGRTWPTGIAEEQLANLNDEFLIELARRTAPKKCVVFAAADIRHPAYESQFTRPPNHGLLTAAFLEGVAEGRADVEVGDGNGAVTLFELEKFISSRYRAFQAASGVAVRFVSGGDLGDMEIVLRPKPAEQ
ncbi:MAG: hypothetical protein KatS3mg102_1722 [Planctomycetota bacterium]|nr:MAG: hypothetical protein KatS3mg102_1722 [Planctomycetota bacterium]